MALKKILKLNPRRCKFCNDLLNSQNQFPSLIKSGSLVCSSCLVENQVEQTPENKKIYKFTCNLRCKSDIIDNYGGKCECCGENIWQFLTIDHINRDGKIHRKENNLQSGQSTYVWLKQNNYPKDGFRLLCMNCNYCSGFNGFCPHQIDTSNLNNCNDCGVILSIKNQFKLHINDEINLCKDCILARSIRKNNRDNLEKIKCGKTVYQSRKDSKSTTLNLRLKLIEGYGCYCECCGQDEYMFLTIDHINNDGAEEMKIFNNDRYKFFRWLISNNFPKHNYRLLCFNCNSSRYIYNMCHHESFEKFGNLSILEYEQMVKNKKIVLP